MRSGAPKSAIQAASLLALLWASPVRAQDGMSIEAHADMQNLVLYRNDTDFDRTRPYYSAGGQDEGAVATVLRPDVTWHVNKGLRLFYQAEIGLNYWGKQNPDQEGFKAPDVFVMKHRQIYGEGEISSFGFKAGFSEFQDATGLFIHHWIGVAQARWEFNQNGRVEAFFGMVPDQTGEGINVVENNFNHDTYVYGATVKYTFLDGLKLTVGVHSLFDTHVVGQIRRLWCPNAELEVHVGNLTGYLDAALQAGRFSGPGITVGGGSQDQLAWALQGRVQYAADPLEFQVNVLALSGDDDYDGNSVNRAFLYSGKSKSATLVFTEDEIRNWYDSLDLRMAGFKDGFYLNRAGLLVADLKATWHATDNFSPALILGVASTLNPHNSLGESYVGVEADLVLQYRLSEHFIAQAMAGVVSPGKAGAALVNRIDLARTEPIYSFEFSLLLRY
jgi:hypothetical protein